MSHAAMFAIATASAEVTALIGTAKPRFYPTIAEASAALPYVTYQLTADPVEQTMGEPVEARRSSFTLTAVAHTHPQALALRDALDAAFSRARGAFGAVTVDDCFIENARDDYDPDLERHVLTLDLTLFWRAS